MSLPKPIHVKPSLYAFFFYNLKEIALKYGYNLVLHGSLNRDLDLIAIPWQEVILPHEPMIKEFAECIGGYIMQDSEPDKRVEFERKFHGRKNYIINVNRTSRKPNYEDAQYYLDISVTPAVTL